MQSRRLSLALAVVAVVVAAGLFVVLRDDADETTTTPTQTTAAEEPVEEPEGREPDDSDDGSDDRNGGGRDEPALPTINVRNGEPVGGVAELEFKRGQPVEFVVRSDADDEIHVHGYDVYSDVEAGERTRVSFPAEFEGVFEVELHDAGVEIARIAINP